MAAVDVAECDCGLGGEHAAAMNGSGIQGRVSNTLLQPKGSRNAGQGRSEKSAVRA